MSENLGQVLSSRQYLPKHEPTQCPSKAMPQQGNAPGTLSPSFYLYFNTDISHFLVTSTIIYKDIHSIFVILHFLQIFYNLL